MKKSIYSLMLFDEIVEVIDQLAYSRGTNRSAMINEILAKEIGLKTPEQKVKAVIKRLNSNASHNLPVKQINENSSIAFGACIKYKYSPKIKYSYEFVSGKKGKYAILKVSSRTTSEELCNHFNRFYNILRQIENEFSNGSSDSKIEFILDSNKMIRTFKEKNINQYDEKEVANYLTNYMKMLNDSMGHYFLNMFEQDIQKQIKKIYIEFLNNN
jgi:hypothetical protein